MSANRISSSPTAAVLGRIGQPAPLRELAREKWDAVVVGAGHNGLTCAAYLAKAGKKVLVLESLERVGGACTLDELIPGVRVSPCAYVIGLFHNRVIDDLALREHGFDWTPASGGMFVPFEDGSHIQLWDDGDKCDAEVRRFAPNSYKGWLEFCDVKRRLRDALRPAGDRDLWLDPNPSREEIERRLGNDEDARNLLFKWSMVDFVERYFDDEKLQMAYLGQGVIGTKASPFTPGTAYIHFHHASGRLDGLAGTWGYVKGGMGTLGFYLCDAAKRAGAVVTTSAPVAEILPGEGVVLEGGEKIHAKQIICNADPKVALRLLGDRAESGWRRQVDSVPIEGCTAKVNLALKELPNFAVKPGVNEGHHLGQVNTPLTKDEWKQSFEVALGGEMPEKVWTELYFHTAHDQSVARDGIHTMSVFAQYVPYKFNHGDWDSRRDDVWKSILGSLTNHITNLPEAIVAKEIMGPPDIEKKVGLTGGHIFQGECLPQYMWERRLKARTSMPGFFLCGAATHPGGSVIGINGRNAALEALKDL